MSTRGIVGASVALAVLILATVVVLRRETREENPSPPLAELRDEPSPQSHPQSGPVSQASAEPAAGLAPADSKRVEIFREILTSRNDNDPRLDTELKNLTPGLKRALRAEYAQSPAEKRNARGTVVFLIGRELRDADDLQFMQAVLTEPACLSLKDCSHRSAPSADEHAAMGIETTLAYPQIVALHSLGEFLAGGPAAPLRQAALEALAIGARSDSPKVAQAASDLQKKYEKR